MAMAARPWLSFAAGLALIEAVAALAPGAEQTLRLKWPNDVMAGEAKLSGLLLESLPPHPGDQDRASMLLGIGVNIVAAPALPDYPTARLADLTDAGVPDPEALLQDFDARFLDWRQRIKNDGTAPLRTAWMARAYGVGRPCRVMIGGQEPAGLFVDVDAGGRLVIETPAGQRAFAAGTVRFERAI